MTSAVPNPLYLLLSDSRVPSAGPAHSGGVEEAIKSGLVNCSAELAEFVFGRLLTVGTTVAFAGAAVCARTARGLVSDSFWRSFEAELDARILSPAARSTSRQQGGALLRRALNSVPDSILHSLARASVTSEQNPHHAVVIGAVAASAGAVPQVAAAAAAQASVTGAAHAGRDLLDLTPKEFEDLTVALENCINLISVEAARFARQSLPDLPAWTAPGLEFLAEEHARREGSVFAS